MASAPGGALTALAAASCWGVGDFTGGLGVRSAGETIPACLSFIVLAHTASLGLLLIAAWVTGAALPHSAALAWGLAAGSISAGAFCAFYLSLNRGAMGISAAISGVLTAAIPAAVSTWSEGLPGWQRGLGFCLAAVAIWLIAAGPGAEAGRAGIVLAMLAGAGFGLYFVALKFAAASGPVGTVATARLGSIATSLVLLLLAGGVGHLRVSRATSRWALLAAVFDTGGNLLYVQATRAGRLDVAAVLASLYPAPTILLAAWKLGERLTRRQMAGLALAGVAVVLVV